MKEKAQSVLEYGILIAAVAMAFTVMNHYINRSISARLKQVQQEISEQPEPGVTDPTK